MPDTVEAIYCPGWTGINGQKHDCGGTRTSTVSRNLLSKRANGEYPAMCPRCERQKKKYDEEHGAREQREAVNKANYEALIQQYVDDLGLLPHRGPIEHIIEGIEGLTARGTFPPFVRGGGGYYQRQEPLPTKDRWNVMRVVCGLPAIYTPGRY